MNRKSLFIYAVVVSALALILLILLIVLCARKWARMKREKSFTGFSSIAGLSHEIRTPLNVIIGFSDMLISHPGDSRSSFYLESIAMAGRSLLYIVNDVLDFAKIESGKMAVSIAPCSLEVILQEMDQIFRLNLEEKNLSLIIENRVDVPLMLDEARIRQILINLITNAIKHTDAGEIKIVSRLESLNGKSDLILSVEDTGRGIAPGDLKKIFNPFEQSAKGKETREGFGLGLAICRKLADLMNGEISAKSVVGRGSVFTCKFFNVRRASFTSLKVEKETEEGVSKEFPGETVLVVDDNFSNAALFSEYLKTLNLSAITCSNGREAVDLAREKKPSLILMDIRMPVMDGYTAAKIIKKDKATSSIPIVAITASVKLSGRKFRKEDLWFDDYLVKPLQIKKLVKLIEKYINSREIRKETSAKTSPPEKRLLSEASPDILEELRNRYIPQIADLKEVIVYSDLIRFTVELLERGKRYNLISLIEYAEELQLLVKSFNMGRIRHRLDDLVSVLENKK